MSQPRGPPQLRQQYDTDITSARTELKELQAKDQKEVAEIQDLTQRLEATNAALSKAQSSSSTPLLTLDYGPDPKTGFGNGLIVTNHREPAFGVNISDISNGRQVARFKKQIEKLTKNELRWVPPDVESLDPNFTAGNFSDAIGDDHPTQFTVRYKDYDGHSFVANYNIIKNYCICLPA